MSEAQVAGYWFGYIAINILSIAAILCAIASARDTILEALREKQRQVKEEESE